MHKLFDYIRWRLGWTPEARCQRMLRRVRLQPGEVAVDCGANVGEMTAVLARDGATVHAFEPNPHAFAVLQKRFAGQANIVCHQASVGCASGRMKLYLHENSAADEILWSNGSSLLSEKPNVSPDRFIEVDGIDLAEFVLGMPERVRLMKMDIEGAEVEVLNHLLDKGAVARIDCLFVETHDAKIPSLAEGTRRVKARFQQYPACRAFFDWV